MTEALIFADTPTGVLLTEFKLEESQQLLSSLKIVAVANRNSVYYMLHSLRHWKGRINRRTKLGRFSLPAKKGMGTELVIALGREYFSTPIEGIRWDHRVTLTRTLILIISYSRIQNYFRERPKQIITRSSNFVDTEWSIIHKWLKAIARVIPLPANDNFPIK